MKLTLTAKVRQGVLWGLVEHYGSQGAAAAALGVSPALFGRWLNMKHLPSRERILERSPLVIRRLQQHGIFVEDIFPATPIRIRDNKLKRSIEVSEELLLDLMHSEPKLLTYRMEDDFERAELATLVNQALETLTPKEEWVLRMRFGLGEYEAQTLQAIGDQFGVGQERIRQIQGKALRKLRHPSRSAVLRPFIEGGTP